MTYQAQDREGARPGLLIGLAVAAIVVIGLVVFLKSDGKDQTGERLAQSNPNEEHPKAQATSAEGGSGLRLIAKSSGAGNKLTDGDLGDVSPDEDLSLTQAFQKALENRIAAVQKKELAELAQQFASSDPDLAVSLIQDAWKTSPRNKASVIHFAVEFGKAFSANDPKAAGALMDSLPPELKMQYATAVGAQWALNDAAGATQWALRAEDPGVQIGLLSAISGTVEQSGSPFLIDAWANALSQSPQAGQYAQHLARTWPISNPDAAMEWVNAIPDPEMRASGFQTMAGAMAGRSYEDAALWVSQFPEDGGIRDQAVDQVSYSWSKSDQEAAKAWAESMGRGLLNENPSQPYVPQTP